MDDLAMLATFERRGFQPRATLIVLNHRRVDPSRDPATAFGPIRRHRAVKAAVERGALILEMPRLDATVALEIERKRLHFIQARDGQVPEGSGLTPIGGLNRVSVRAWLERMEAAFAPVSDWLP